MKFITKLCHVTMAVILFISIGYIYNNKASIMTNFTDTNESISNTVEIPFSNENQPAIENLEPMSETPNLHPDYTDTNNTVVVVTEIPSNPYLYPELNFDMTPIKDHDIKHVFKMLTIISDYNESPHGNMSTLVDQLNTKNFIHIQNELSTKNQPVNESITLLLASLNSTDLESVPDEVSMILDSLFNILEQLSEVN